MDHKKPYDAIVIGGGISGASRVYALARYTNVKRILLIEKHPRLARVNSSAHSNSQTLHDGRIETNYSIIKAASVKEATDLLVTYLTNVAPNSVYRKEHKMVLAVGDAEAAELTERYHAFKTLYPDLRMIGAAEIAELEPNVMKGRDVHEKVLALATTEGYTVDFAALAESFIEEAKKEGKELDILLDTEVDDITKTDTGYDVETSKATYSTKTVAVMTGPHSLVFAKLLGYGTHLGLLPVSGDFFLSKLKNLLFGKVYTVQKPKLPFAAVHGDPELADPSITRFGPTAGVHLGLERGQSGSFFDFLAASVVSVKGIKSLLRIISDKVLFPYMLKNMLYKIPFLKEYFFVKEARKIIPTLRWKDIKFAKGYGGIRPQIVNTLTGELEMGEAEIIGDNILFNITPSPGASTCLANAKTDAERIVKFLGYEYTFDSEKWNNDYASTMKYETV